MNTLTVDKLKSLSEEQIIADELARFTESMRTFKNQQKHDKIFLNVCGKGDYRKVKMLVTAGTDVNQVDEDGRTGLHLAAASVRSFRNIISLFFGLLFV